MNSLYLALRVSTSGNGTRSTPAIKVAIAAVTLSVAVMLAAIAIVLGFKEEITKKVLGFNPHIVLKVNPSLSHDDFLIDFSDPLQSFLQEIPYISHFSLSASAPAIFKTENDFKGVYLRSLEKDEMEDFIKSQLIAGNFPDLNKDKNHILISELAANQLNIEAGDTLPTFFITQDVSVEPLIVSGVFNSHFTTYDDIYAFGALDFIQDLGGINHNQGTYVNIYIDDFNKLTEYSGDLRNRLNNAYSSYRLYQYYDIETALSSGAGYFSWLSLLDTNVVVILILMTAVALITLISGMMILIVDKKNFIIIMKALGASNRLLRKIFVWLTLKVALTGMIIGNILIIAFLLFQEKYHFLPLDADSYYIDFVPVKLTAASIIILNVAILAITYFMLIIPSYFVGSVGKKESYALNKSE